jgi:GT2 family glycosyltransferase
MQATISLSIVLFKTSESELVKVYQSIIQTKRNWKLYLVDNSPTDRLRTLFADDARVEYIYNDNNLGFGKAHNIAIKKASREGMKYHFIVNPDIYFLGDVITPMVEMIEKDNTIGMIMPKILNEDGSVQHLPKLLPRPTDLFLRKIKRPNTYYNNFINRYELREVHENSVYNAPVLSGCFTLLNLQAIQVIGAYDESYFMYFEDWDLSRRMHKAFKTLYFPLVEVFHGYDSGANRSSKLLQIFITSAYRYFNKWGWIYDKDRTVFNSNALMQFEKP